MTDLAEEIEVKTGRPIRTVNIGGGLSSSYDSDSEPEEFSFKTYRKKLETVPNLFSGKWQVFSEFGRCLTLKAGFTATRIEAVKSWLGDVNPRLMVHLGAQQFPWETYFPQVWKHRFAIADKDGKLKNEAERAYDIAGPLGFQVSFLTSFQERV